MARKRAWTLQDKRQVDKHGATKAGWYVGYVDPAGKRKQKSCGSGQRGKKLAEKLADQIHSELTSGKFKDDKKEK